MNSPETLSAPRAVRRETIAVGIALVVFAVIVAYDALRMGQESGFELDGPAIFPLITGFGLLAVGTAFLIGALRGRDASLLAHLTTERQVSHMRVVVKVLALLVAYALLLKGAGYPIMTTLLFVITARILGSRRWVLNVVIAVVLSVGIYLAFTEVLRVRLPLGTWLGG